MIENCGSPSPQMIAKQPYEKRKGPFLINMWEVDFPCKAGLLRRKVCVCPLCTHGLRGKLVWFCRRLCLHLGYLRRVSAGRVSLLLLYRCKETPRKKDGIVLVCVPATYFCAGLEVYPMPFAGGREIKHAEVTRREQTSA